MTRTDAETIVIAPYVALAYDGMKPPPCWDCGQQLGGVVAKLGTHDDLTFVPYAVLWFEDPDGANRQRDFCLACAANHAPLEAFMTRRRS
jgi:hypothetical protein